MNSSRHNCDVLVVGAGPAGIAAAVVAAEGGRRVALVDDNPSAGGQIWRGASRSHEHAPEASLWFERLRKSGVNLVCGARVFHQPASGQLLAETWDGVSELGYDKLILATGARELFLPFPGWTLPNVTGAGGLQALVKAGLSIAGKKIVVAGSGPLLVAVAAYLRRAGGDLRLIAEQASRTALLRFGLGLLTQPGKIAQAAKLRRQLSGVPYLAGCQPVAAHGDGRLARVTVRRGARTFDVECDYLAWGFHLVPNIELPLLVGCATDAGAVRVDEFQMTSVSDVYCAGEPTGIGGLELSLVEGRSAGLAAAGKRDEARRLFGERARQRRFAARLNRTFAPRDELKSLPDAETVVCRCEDVTFAQLREHDSWRAAKLHTRCGMGPCQGRICGAASGRRHSSYTAGFCRCSEWTPCRSLCNSSSSRSRKSGWATRACARRASNSSAQSWTKRGRSSAAHWKRDRREAQISNFKFERRDLSSAVRLPCASLSRPLPVLRFSGPAARKQQKRRPTACPSCRRHPPR